MSTTGTLTFLSTDLVGSTEMLSLLGDDAAVNIHRQADEVLRRSITRGQEVWNLDPVGSLQWARAHAAGRTWVSHTMPACLYRVRPLLGCCR